MILILINLIGLHISPDPGGTAYTLLLSKITWPPGEWLQGMMVGLLWEPELLQELLGEREVAWGTTMPGTMPAI